MIFLTAISKLIGLLRSPRQQWKALQGEVLEDPNSVVNDYALPLILISDFLMLAFSGTSSHIVIVYGIAGFVLPVLVLTLTNGLVYKLAPKFESSADKGEVTKFVTYASSPLWIGTIFNPFETLSFIGWLGSVLYSLILYKTGLQVMLEVPETKQRKFFGVISGVIVLLNVITILLTSAIYRVFIVGNVVK